MSPSNHIRDLIIKRCSHTDKNLNNFENPFQTMTSYSRISPLKSIQIDRNSKDIFITPHQAALNV